LPAQRAQQGSAQNNVASSSAGADPWKLSNWSEPGRRPLQEGSPQQSLLCTGAIRSSSRMGSPDACSSRSMSHHLAWPSVSAAETGKGCPSLTMLGGVQSLVSVSLPLCYTIPLATDAQRPVCCKSCTAVVMNAGLCTRGCCFLLGEAAGAALAEQAVYKNSSSICAVQAAQIEVCTSVMLALPAKNRCLQHRVMQGQPRHKQPY
jgi:hypothetical protein